MELEDIDSSLHSDERIPAEGPIDRGQVLTGRDVDYLIPEYQPALGNDMDKARRAVRTADSRLTLIRDLAAKTKAGRAAARLGQSPTALDRNVAHFEFTLGDGVIQLSGYAVSGRATRGSARIERDLKEVNTTKSIDLPEYPWFKFENVTKDPDTGRQRSAQYDSERKIVEWLSQYLVGQLRNQQQAQDKDEEEEGWTSAPKKRPTRADAVETLTERGFLRLYTERVMCPSCVGVIKDFKARWPTIGVDAVGS